MVVCWIGYYGYRLTWRTLKRPIYVIWWMMLIAVNQWWCMFFCFNNFLIWDFFSFFGKFLEWFWVFLFCWVLIFSDFDGLFLDYSRQCATAETMDKLFKLAEVTMAVCVCVCVYLYLYVCVWLKWGWLIYFLWLSFLCVLMQAARLKKKITSMFNGEHVSGLIWITSIVINLSKN